MKRLLVLSILLVPWTSGCSDPEGDADADIDGDTDIDADTDADADGDRDVDADALSTCQDDGDCDDGLFCTGVERCDPGSSGSDDRGCLRPGEPPCESDELCLEEEDRCEVDDCSVADGDGDGHARVTCGGDDCDDADADRFPGNVERCDEADHDEDCDAATFGFRDDDLDGYIDSRCCNEGSGGQRTCGEDCDDSEPATRPGNSEVCDGLDNDCDGEIDEGVLDTYWIDGDGDGYGSSDDDAETVEACSLPAGYSANPNDCDDEEDEVHPAAVEVCDGVDNNCDGETDPGCDCTDGDSVPCGIDVGLCERGTQLCVGGRYDACTGGVDPTPEICNGGDDDCDGLVDEGVLNTYYRDDDGDGFGDPLRAAVACTPPAGYIANNTDCDDTRATIHPGAAEICDRLDSDCSSGGGVVEEEDMDDDGHAPLGTTRCTGGPLPADDCNDESSDVHPGQWGYFHDRTCPPRTSWCESLDCCGDDFTIYPDCTRPADQCVDEPSPYDYDCNGVDEPMPPFEGCFLYACGRGGPSYFGSPPACGEDVTFIACVYTGGACVEQPPATRPMPCR